LSEGVPATMRTNLGLGTVATKTASDVTKTNASMVNGATTIGHIAVFSDVNGTVEDGGPASLSTFTSFVNGRITLTSGLPVTTANVTGATTIFFTPYKGNQISLFDGASTWTTLTFAETSIAVPGTTSTMYDLFAFNNAGTMALETQAWTNDTTRAVGLVLQNGIYVKNGATTRRYLGSFRTTTVNGRTEDSITKRYIWNYANRVTRSMLAVDATVNWTYSVAAFRQANANTANQLDCVIGVSEDAASITVASIVANSTTTVRQAGTGIGLNSTTVNSAQIMSEQGISFGNGQLINSYYTNPLPAGRNFIVWLERGAGADTQTWFGSDGLVVRQSGITGIILG
jgi:hypothetical protein